MNSLQASQEIRAYILLLVDLLKGVAWPLMVLSILIYFRNEIGVFLTTISKNKETLIKIAGAEIKLTAGEASDALAGLFTEFDLIIDQLLTKEEVELFLKISNERRTPTVATIILGFNRQPDELKKLRALRGAYFIRPLEGIKWESQKYIEITTLGKLVLRYKKAELLKKVSAV